MVYHAMLLCHGSPRRIVPGVKHGNNPHSDLQSRLVTEQEKALALRLRKAAPSSKLGAPGNSYPTYGTLLVLLVLAEYDYGP